MSQTPSEVRRLLDRHGLAPRKALGQHFLADPNLVDRIVRFAAVPEGWNVVEVGAGTGSLTVALARRHRVRAYEVDRGMEPVLHEVLDGMEVDLRFEDATGVDWSGLTGRWAMVANLPYNVGTPVLLDALRTGPSISRFCVMVQKEVGDRLTAQPGSRDYGLPSVVVGLHATHTGSFDVGPGVFVPPPRVGSVVVRLDRVEPPAGAEEAIRLASAAFSQRRKMLRQSLRSVLDDPIPVLERAGIDPTRRPETLAVPEWLRLVAGA